jgi:cell division protein FtsB
VNLTGEDIIAYLTRIVQTNERLLERIKELEAYAELTSTRINILERRIELLENKSCLAQ